MERLADVKGDLNKSRWRYRLIPGRSGAMPRPFCADDGRSAATRRQTFGTGAVLRTAYLEKTGCFIVMTANKCRVFQCTVN
ncbi:hypothetical protein GmarT_20690 [Gimesia maris]|uniref:Uncharacterized protein n=1 Tax=Gimesia maris TaxID=122 RepID=A0ABX5YKP8_9PLAN|nr:hypothetical protein CA11_20320 [Gimesia maris]QEG16207.1 hypothetical protein GmarT_20690 [Gimesia maris]